MVLSTGTHFRFLELLSLINHRHGIPEREQHLYIEWCCSFYIYVISDIYFSYIIFWNHKNVPLMVPPPSLIAPFEYVCPTTRDMKYCLLWHLYLYPSNQYNEALWWDLIISWFYIWNIFSRNLISLLLYSFDVSECRIKMYI